MVEPQQLSNVINNSYALQHTLPITKNFYQEQITMTSQRVIQLYQLFARKIYVSTFQSNSYSTVNASMRIFKDADTSYFKQINLNKL